MFNLSEIPRDTSPPLYLECYGGDIFSVPSDVVLLSAFAGCYAPVPGGLFDSLRSHCQVSFQQTLPAGTRTFSGRLHHVPVPSTTAFSDLWIIDLRDLSQKGPLSQGEMRSILGLLIEHTEHLISRAGTTLSLPMLGTGDQGLEIGTVAGEIIELARRWARSENRLSVLRVFAYDLKRAAALNRSIDNVLRFPALSNERSDLLRAAADELARSLKRTRNAAIRHALQELHELVHVQDFSAKSVAIQGRIVTEVCIGMILHKFRPDEYPPPGLNERIKLVQSEILNRKPWMFSYLKLLQTCGNHFAHPSTFRLETDDVAAVLLAATRFAAFCEWEVSS